jgi:hypothetical protein
MESFLNILWLVIALCALYVWRIHWAHQKPCTQRTPLQQWTAFLCGLVLLFFAVSLTDDLHSEIILFDECASGRRSCAMCSYVHAAPDSAKIPATYGVAILPRIAAPVQLAAISMFSPVAHIPGRCFAFNLCSDRAPPTANL